MSKINFVYKTFNHLGSRYTENYGLEQEFKRQGRLHYSYNVSGGEFLNVTELQKYPIVFICGGMSGMGPTVDACGDQFKVSLESESYYTRHGKVDAPGLKDRLKKFNLVLTFAESDKDIYSKPTFWMPSWVDLYKYEN